MKRLIQKPANLLEELGRFILFIVDSIRWLFRPPFRYRQIIDEMEFIGNGSLLIVCVASVFIGAVFTYQTWLGFRFIGTNSLVSSVVGLALIRELSPVMTAIVVAGRAGSAMAAQLGLMRVTEQIDALEIMAVSPKQYLVAPRLIAALISVPLLCCIFSLVGNFSAYLVGISVCQIDPGVYMHKLKMNINPVDFFHGMTKAVFFGFFIAAIGCYQGYNATRGAEGVGRATNVTVVYSIVFILVADYFLTTLLPIGIGASR